MSEQQTKQAPVAYAQFEDGRAVAVSFIRSETTGCTTPLISTDAVRGLLPELEKLAADIDRAGINGFGNRVLAIHDDLEVLTRGAA